MTLEGRVERFNRRSAKTRGRLFDRRLAKRDEKFQRMKKGSLMETYCVMGKWKYEYIRTPRPSVIHKGRKP